MEEVTELMIKIEALLCNVMGEKIFQGMEIEGILGRFDLVECFRAGTSLRA